MERKNKIKKNEKIGRRRAAFPTRFLICGLLILFQIALTVFFVTSLGHRLIYAQAILTLVSIVVLIHVLNKDEPAAHKLVWSIVIILLSVAGVVIYCMFGSPQQTRKAKKRFEQVNKEASLYLKPDETVYRAFEEQSPCGRSLSEYLETVCGIPAFVNTETKYLPSGEQFFASLIEDIKRAENYIFLEYFIVMPGEIWNALHNALVERVMAGVRVFMLYDDIGSMKKTPGAFDIELRREGISCYKFNPFLPIATTLHNNRDHRKIAVIDGKIAYTGGVNIADEYANVEEPFGKWKDCAVRVCGDAVQGFVFMFTQLYNVFAPEPLDPAEFLARTDGVKSDGFVQPYADGPRPAYNDYIGKNLYLGIIYSAKKYLYIATPYLIMGYEAEEALVFAAKRGVDVRIITPHVPDKKYVFAMTRSAYAKLIAAGVKIYEYGPGFMHSKIILADDELGVVGTVNFDYRSFVHHYECGCFMCETSALKDIKDDYLTTALKDGILQTEESAKLTLYEKAVKIIMGLFAPLL